VKLLFEFLTFPAAQHTAQKTPQSSPVENVDSQTTIMAKKKQILFFALVSPLECGGSTPLFIHVPVLEVAV
jgi:hypothetical protein